MALSKLGKYEIISEVGRGGFGIVYRARDTKLDRIVAIKVLKPLLVDDPVFMERFEREAQAAANLKHPSIVALYDFGEEQGMQFIAMEYLEGESLAQIIAHAGTLSLERVGTLLAQIADALDYAHGKGLIHRDVKPSNMLVSANDHATLTDFGLVKAEDGSGMSTSGQMMGTAEYMAPEQAEGKVVDARTDVYALGIVLFEMLTGQVPFKADTTLATLYKQVNEPPPSIRSLRSDLPQAIENVVNRALAKQSDARYPTAGALNQAVQRAIHDATARAAPQVPERLRRDSAEPITLPRIWAIVGITLAVVVLLIGLASFLSLVGSPKPNQMVMVADNPPTRTPGWMTATPTARIITLTECKSSLVTIKQEYWDKVPPDVKAHALSSQNCAPIEKYIDDLILARPTSTPQATQTARVIVVTVTPSPTATPTETPRVTPTPRAGDTRTFAPDNAPMQFVPAGEFTMGSDSSLDNEKPVHTVYLDTYWMDKYEVTNTQYNACLNAGKCTRPTQTKSSTRDAYFGNAQYDNYPVIYVDWNQAKAYCGWAGKRLPTEAEWEKAARGTDERIYPWGNSISDGIFNNSWESGKRDTMVVGSYPSGASPYGIMDMAGNVWEWIADWYGIYASGTQRNPLGPTSGQNRLGRGGSFSSLETFVRATRRVSFDPSVSLKDLGFRCVRSP